MADGTSRLMICRVGESVRGIVMGQMGEEREEGTHGRVYKQPLPLTGSGIC